MKWLLIIAAMTSAAFADSPQLQQKLIDIANEEAQIANIGANKAMMLYGANNALDTINKWNKIQNNPPLSNEQITQIQHLENIKQQLLKQSKTNEQMCG